MLPVSKRVLNELQLIQPPTAEKALGWEKHSASACVYLYQLGWTLTSSARSYQHTLNDNILLIQYMFISIYCE